VQTRNGLTAICVLGMHRSGTSAVTAAIHALGADLGPESQRMAVRADNPEGFFEHQGLTDLNDELLEMLGGSWHEPPAVSPGWEHSPGLQDLRDRAERLLRDDFGDCPLWAWKDPRTCLTLPFWRRFLPADLKCIVCVRHPLDVAQSLRRRDGFSIEKGVDLWVRYTSLALAHRSGAPTLLVAYDDLVDRHTSEVRRLQSFVSPTRANPLLATEVATDVVKPRLRHFHADLDAREASDAASTLYMALVSLVARQQGRELDQAELDLIGPLLARTSLASAERERVAPRAAETTELREALVAATAQIDCVRRERDALRAACEETLNAERSSRLAAERERSRLEALLQRLATPAGVVKLALRVGLPAPVHSALRRLVGR
jgi:hypothetical protein